LLYGKTNLPAKPRTKSLETEILLAAHSSANAEINPEPTLLSEEEIQKLSPMRRPIVQKPLGIAYGTDELPAMIASSRDRPAYRSQGHALGDLNHFTILDDLREPNSTLTRAALAMAQY
jgi:hypothetical protein